MFGRRAGLKYVCASLCICWLTACAGEAYTRTGTGGASGGSAGGGVPGASGSSGAAGSSGNAGVAGLTGGGGAPGIECRTNFDCPQTNCFGCPQLVCVNGHCTTSSGGSSGTGGSSGLGGSPAMGGGTADGGSLSTGGSSAAGAGGALPACGATAHLPQCEEYTRHTCALCNPAGCDENQVCYALSSCDSLYVRCAAHFACALAATTCATFQACEKCQL